MIWLALAGLAFLAALVAEGRRMERWPHAAAATFFAALALWLWTSFGESLFASSEAGLVKGFLVAALIGLLAEILILIGRGQSALHLIPVAALGYAAGLDVLRPDEYSYIPAAIVGLLVLLVAGRAFLRLRQGGGVQQAVVAGHSMAQALMLYAALFKLIDRGWALPWAYLTAAGGLLYAASHLWLGWGEVLGRERLHSRWLQSAAYLGGQALLIVAAGSHYQAFL